MLQVVSSSSCVMPVHPMPAYRRGDPSFGRCRRWAKLRSMAEEDAPVSMTKGNGPWPATHTLTDASTSEPTELTVIGSRKAPLASAATPLHPEVFGDTANFWLPKTRIDEPL